MCSKQLLLVKHIRNWFIGKQLLDYYKDLPTDNGLYNPRHLPFYLLATMQKPRNSVGWNKYATRCRLCRISDVWTRKSAAKPIYKDYRFTLFNA